MMASAVSDQGESPPVVQRASARQLAQRLLEATPRPDHLQRPVRATYRLQFRPDGFGFDSAKDVAAYLSELGVSHVYASPCLQAHQGSSHGYDIVDPARLNAELGAEAAFCAYADELQAQELGLILDVVPNHMSVNAAENRWWADVLRHGEASRFASYFDIDWQPVKRELEHKILLPVLGDLSGNVLEAGRLRIEEGDGGFCVRGDGLWLPLDPRTWTRILRPNIDELSAALGAEAPEFLEMQSILSALDHLPPRTETSRESVAARARETMVISGRLKQLVDRAPPIAAHIQSNLKRLNGTPGDSRSFDELDRLFSEQAYQLVHWKAGSDEMNYRRFFDITDLAAICMEHRDVFEESHALLFRLLSDDRVQGLRIDHIDGLFDPVQYLWRLQCGYVQTMKRRANEAAPDSSRCHRAAPGGPAELPGDEDLEWRPEANENPQPEGGREAGMTRSQRLCLPLYVVVEKILEADESLPAEWPVQGTTGYDFLNQLNGLYLDGRGLRELERYYARFTSLKADLRETIYRSKRLIVEGAMQSELQLLAHRLNRLSNRHRRSRDYTLPALRSALREIIACFPVYRTYIRGPQVADRDRKVIQVAVAQARRRNPSIDAAIFDFIRDVLLLEQPPQLDAEGQSERNLFIGRLQQVTSPVVAKGVEDTAFYRHVPLASINEVGGEPDHPVTAVREFHRQNLQRQADWPRSLLATTTHDTKRSEDVRARINVLSEIPGQWRSAVQRWARWNRRYRREVDGQPAPSRNDEWLFYQTLVGMWPPIPPSDEDRASLIGRLQAYMEKAGHEAKLRTSWINPSAAYDSAMREFVAQVLTPQDSRFLLDFERLLDSILDCGLYTALSQAFLKLICPGTPDIYQGQELWDFSLVDPDNRRPVDFVRRRSLLGEIKRQASTPAGRRALAGALARTPRDDRLKLFVTWTSLQFRESWPQLEEANYIPLELQGACAEHACALAWVTGGDRPSQVAIAVAPRLILSLTESVPTRAPCGAEVWQDTAVSLRDIPDLPLYELMTGQPVQRHGGTLPLATLLADFPVALVASAASPQRSDP